MKRILYIAPLPPPVTGQSFVSQFIIDSLRGEYRFEIINFSRTDAIAASRLSVGLLKNALGLGRRIRRAAPRADVIYLTISQSLLGNLKDLFFIGLMGRHARRLVVHLHGGGFRDYLRRTPGPVRVMNRALFRRARAGIVLGPSLVPQLAPILPPERIRVVPNFYAQSVRASREETAAKWREPCLLKVLFFSNLMREKGFLDLLDAFTALSESARTGLELTFSGEFQTESLRRDFFRRTAGFPGVRYVGVTSGRAKADLLKSSHALFLPTFCIEGQPVSMLEAYAAGLAVFATNQGGIPDIFENGKNGRLLEKRSVRSIADALLDLEARPGHYATIALANLEYAARFSEEAFLGRMRDIFGAEGTRVAPRPRCAVEAP